MCELLAAAAASDDDDDAAAADAAARSIRIYTSASFNTQLDTSVPTRSHQTSSTMAHASEPSSPPPADDNASHQGRPPPPSPLAASHATQPPSPSTDDASGSAQLTMPLHPPPLSRHDARCRRCRRGNAERHAAVRWLQPHWEQRVRPLLHNHVVQQQLAVRKCDSLATDMVTASATQRGAACSRTNGSTPNITTASAL